MGDGKGAVGTGTFRMHAPFGNDFAVEVREFFQKPDILQELWTTRSRCHHVLIMGDRTAGIGGQFLWSSWRFPPRWWIGALQPMAWSATGVVPTVAVRIRISCIMNSCE